MVLNFSSRALDLVYKQFGWTIKGEEDYALEKPDLSLHKAELNTELAGAGGVDDSASGASTLKRKQSAAPLANPVEDNSNAFYASVSAVCAAQDSWECKPTVQAHSASPFCLPSHFYCSMFIILILLISNNRLPKIHPQGKSTVQVNMSYFNA